MRSVYLMVMLAQFIHYISCFRNNSDYIKYYMIWFNKLWFGKKICNLRMSQIVRFIRNSALHSDSSFQSFYISEAKKNTGLPILVYVKILSAVQYETTGQYINPKIQRHIARIVTKGAGKGNNHTKCLN